MNIKVIRALIIIAIAVFVLFISSIAIVSCAFMKKSTKNHLATAELNLIMFQVEQSCYAKCKLFYITLFISVLGLLFLHPSVANKFI